MLVSALFIDFDNVFSFLRRDDPSVAARFAQRQLHWLKGLEADLELPNETASRRIVARRCYASPFQIQPYRRNFTSAGFEVIDCPSLTAQMKNGADIMMVMDIIDYLTRYPRIEEFIILSADADFVPVLARLRKEMKRSAIFTAANTSSAYRNCADCTIDTEFFAAHLETGAAQGISPATDAASAVSTPAPFTPPAAPPVDPALAKAVRDVLIAAAGRSGRVPFATAAQALLTNLGPAMGGNWAGRRSFTNLLAAVELPGIEVDWRAQMLRGAVSVALAGWEAPDREALGGFVARVIGAARKRIPEAPPAAFALIIEELTRRYSAEPPVFSEVIAAVVDACAAGGFAVPPQEVRFIAGGIMAQGYRFGPNADPVELAALWRLQVETVEAAREDFLARTADEVIEPADAVEASASSPPAL